MIYEGVNFNEDAVKKLSKDTFITDHIDLLWTKREAETRRKMLEEVYDIFNPPDNKTKKKKK